MATIPYNKHAVIRRSAAYGSLEVRFAAYLIDTCLFLFGQSLMLYFIIGYPYSPDLSSGLLLPQFPTFISNFDYLGKFLYANMYFTIIHWLYYAMMESSTRQGTVGKIVMQIKVTDLNGQRISFGQATVRYLGKFLSVGLFFGGFLVALFNHRHQTLHDIIAGCVVRISKID
ncbi:RDD family protein [Adhaeribacter sp. BT258]|uniref:RDD family protein n=1 Tax=Adhaeribacter terrigena TaxID=2793070 RepID=A0ABS1C5G7_9BACT|nr:RDD family protein [Adhaeribacter terrigena]MBK0404612.1 RDD family protein [Adhaeribacter terrigena]